MASALFGEALSHLGDGRVLTLRFDFDALCAVEDLVGDGRIDEVLAEMAGPINPATGKPVFRKPRLRTQFRLLYGATRFHHGELTPDDCKGLVSAHNSEILWPMLSALGRAMGKKEEIDAATGEGGEAAAVANPRPSAPGIGESSSTDGAPRGSTRRASEAKRPALTQEP
jgi:hypothetical protein